MKSSWIKACVLTLPLLVLTACSTNQGINTESRDMAEAMSQELLKATVIVFNNEESELTEDDKTLLDMHVAFLSYNPQQTMTVTASTGKAANIDLVKQQGHGVIDYLISKGIESHRIDMTLKVSAKLINKPNFIALNY